MNPTFRRSLHGAGSLLAIVGIVVVAVRLWDYGISISFSSLPPLFWGAVAGLALVYGLSNTLLARAWWNLLLQYGETGRWQCALRIYGLSALAKYVPGNVMHIASRQALGLAAGFGGWALVKASAWELGLISVAGALFIAIVMPGITDQITTPYNIVLFLTVFAVIVAGISRCLGSSPLKAFCLYVGFLAASGCCFALLLTFRTDLTASNALLAGGAFVVAWLVGLVTPGAPAGLGVRELVLMLILEGFVAEPDLLFVLLLSRIVTVVGDCLFFVFFVSTGYGKVQE